MNLHALVSGVVSAVNPLQQIVIRTSTGYSTNSDGSRTPAYAAPVTVMAQVQPLEYTDLVRTDGLNIAGLRRKVYVSGEYNSIVRVSQKGGDLVTLADGSVWLVVQVLEQWPDWCSFCIVEQNGS